VPIPELTMTAWLRFGSIRRALAVARPRRLLEVGAGEGGLGAWLARHFDYVGVEPDQTSRAVARQRLRALGRGELCEVLADDDRRRYDAVCAFEVLEHIQDDGGALRSWREKLQPRGHLLISVPAHSAQFGLSDRYVGHFRRYDRGALGALLEAEGFEILQWHSYGAGLGHAIDRFRNFFLSRRAATSTAAEGTALSGRLFQPKSTARALLNYLVALPFRVLQLPFASSDIGIGYVVLARLR
jgi:2-polyprenyl-3-methyl-5-hydroxy-6-metoxy-1,4-benzoquinol methylase